MAECRLTLVTMLSYLQQQLIQLANQFDEDVDEVVNVSSLVSGMLTLAVAAAGVTVSL